MILVASLLALSALPLVCWVIDASTDARVPRWRVAASLGAAVTFLVVALPPDPVLVTLSFGLAVLGVTLAFVDIAIRRLPDVLVLTAYPPTGAILITAAVASGDPEPLLRAGFAAAVCLMAYGLAASSGALGFGDAKLAGLLGLVLGWVSWAAVLSASLLALLLAVVPAIMARIRRGRGAEFAFGPPMLGGALLALPL
ncbi:prepilin peptidase [Stackebrandtia nassauensis]|uniref:Peptidase A24A prepilin type IV n=1 Tax=Stackebrandtia nassauensis (strain DSM 44728 / CIP 108903 / NRRL B-16338 / NBRC 102104 / LLR-40K-21) TaxID=446470 RepID=D3QAM7_STANL|nr:prepilin peptidase [Stackebrandtia nassauensis]ADD42810.1 peptidase A24A prepilin type IV [Stackebrandtia nassauensis DSM 44728]